MCEKWIDSAPVSGWTYVQNPHSHSHSYSQSYSHTDSQVTIRAWTIGGSCNVALTPTPTLLPTHVAPTPPPHPTHTSGEHGEHISILLWVVGALFFAAVVLVCCSLRVIRSLKKQRLQKAYQRTEELDAWDDTNDDEEYDGDEGLSGMSANPFVEPKLALHTEMTTVTSQKEMAEDEAANPLHGEKGPSQ